MEDAVYLGIYSLVNSKLNVVLSNETRPTSFTCQNCKKLDYQMQDSTFDPNLVATWIGVDFRSNNSTFVKIISTEKGFGSFTTGYEYY